MHAIGAAAAAGSRRHGRHSDGDQEAALLAREDQDQNWAG